MKELTGEWVQKAEGDFLVAQRESHADKPVYDAICFHSQQCVEKYLKAVLQENGVEFQKTHDLDLLLDKCERYRPELSKLAKDLIELSSFAVEIRYPGMEAAAEDAQSCMATAAKIRRIIRKYLMLAE